MPTFELALGLGMVRCAADVIHALIGKPIREVAGDVGRAIVAEQAGLVNDLGAIAS